MDQRILEFIGDLRRAEVRISPSEALDALGATAEIGLEDRETFKSALASTLVKEARDRETFDRIFNLYFLDLEALGEGLKKALGPEDPKMQEMLDQLANQGDMDLDEMTELLLRGQGSEMEMAIRSGGQNAGLERLNVLLGRLHTVKPQLQVHQVLHHAVFRRSRLDVPEEYTRRTLRPSLVGVQRLSARVAGRVIYELQVQRRWLECLVRGEYIVGHSQRLREHVEAVLLPASD